MIWDFLPQLPLEIIEPLLPICDKNDGILSPLPCELIVSLPPIEDKTEVDK